MRVVVHTLRNLETHVIQQMPRQSQSVQTHHRLLDLRSCGLSFRFGCYVFLLNHLSLFEPFLSTVPLNLFAVQRN